MPLPPGSLTHTLGHVVRWLTLTFALDPMPFADSRTLLWKVSSPYCNIQFSLSLANSIKSCYHFSHHLKTLSWPHITLQLSLHFWVPFLPKLLEITAILVFSIKLYLCNLSDQASSSTTPGTLLLSRPPWTAVLTSRVSPCPQLLADHFLILKSVGFWTPHSWFFSYSTWRSFSASFGVSSLLRLLDIGCPRVQFSELFSSLSTLILFKISFYLYTMSHKCIFPTKTFSLHASVLYAATLSIGHKGLKGHLPPRPSSAAIPLGDVTIASHLINCSSFLTSLPVSTLFRLQSFLEIVVRAILLIHADHILLMLQTPTFLHLGVKVGVLMLVTKASTLGTPPSLPAPPLQHTGFLAVCHWPAPLPLKTPVPDVISLPGMIFFQIDLTRGSVSSLLWC